MKDVIHLEIKICTIHWRKRRKLQNQRIRYFNTLKTELAEQVPFIYSTLFAGGVTMSPCFMQMKSKRNHSKIKRHVDTKFLNYYMVKKINCRSIASNY